MHKPNASPGTTSFTLNQYRSMYNYPAAGLIEPITVAVLSFGGGLFGSVSASGILTDGDVQAQWTSLGMPTVKIVLINGATNRPVQNEDATIENTIDVATIGALCPSPLLTIVLIIGSQTSSFSSVLRAAIAQKPSIISCSWGLDEKSFNRYEPIATVNALLASAVAAGINVTAATGDWGSSDGAPGLNVDFPSSSPYVIACGGTTLTCPSGIYSGVGTREIAWSSGGGGKSVYCSRPAWQPASLGPMRSSPDIAMNADPATGVVYRVGGASMIVGGTSIVSPAFAAFLACIRPTQFVAPLLYMAPTTCYNDILVGSNGPSGTYNAGAGHDNCTGLGSIKGTLLAAAIGSVITLAPAQIPVKVTSIKLQPTLALAVGSSSTVSAIIAPASATNKSLAWTSQNASVASVNPSTGLITAVDPGRSILTVVTTDGSNKRASIMVTVVQLVTSLSVPSVTITRKGAKQLALTVSPANASNKSVTWSSNSTFVTVNSKGVVRAANQVSTAVITVRSTDGSNRVASCVVTVQ